ncbi:uncharacterized protein LOC109535996 isoform X1 [Dendroctonus ponderosae]|uniref:uncharacterized protein LOC109535996 isoform X1 n=1 Tax=Dendroctonus ponderosae TaxID=77166 RepID=UPI0020366327|nr:uncharacterized protein LOC109535996 isoform X1 [Dendroctonus ponderosae]
MALRILAVLVAVLSSSGQAQRYFIGEEAPEDYYNSQQVLTNPQQQYYQNPSSTYYLPKQLPAHPQQPQYNQQPSARQFPFRLAQDEYVAPSTHRPDYSRVLPNHRLQQDQHAHYPSELTGNAFEPEPASKEARRLDFNKEENGEDEYLEESDYGASELNDKRAASESAAAKEDKAEAPNELDDEEYDEDDEEYEYEDEDEGENNNLNNETKTTNEAYEVLTVKPTKPMQNGLLDGFVDVDLMDTTTQEPATSNFQSSVLPPKEDSNETRNFPELVVSVVTSKTIVNNTVISPIAYNASTVPSAEMGVSVENSTDSWIVIASVQTSRSISGARYIPSTSVDQDERRQLLNEGTLSETEATILETELTSPMSSPRPKTSTESLIDKLDRVQSDLSSRVLTGGFKNDNIAIIDENLTTKVEASTEATVKKPYPQVNIRKFDAGNRAVRPTAKKSEPKRKPVAPKPLPTDQSPTTQDPLSLILQKIKPVEDISALLPPGYRIPSSEELLKSSQPVNDITNLLPPGYTPPQPATSTIKSILDVLPNEESVEDISALLPPGFKLPATTEKPLDSLATSLLSKAKPVEDISFLLPPGFKQGQPGNDLLSKAKPVQSISALLPPGYKAPSSKSKLEDNVPAALLPPGYKPGGTTEKPAMKVFSKAKPVDDISALLPPGYKAGATPPAEKSVSSILAKAQPVEDISALLPPGFKKGFSRPKVTTTPPSVNLETVSQNIPNNLLPPGFKPGPSSSEPLATSTDSSVSPSAPLSSGSGGLKIVFPSRPGGGARKTPRLTTPRGQAEDGAIKPTSPSIRKAWPVRSSTEFTGWPTPSTTPISIEKLLEAARTAFKSTSTEEPVETTSTTTTTTTTTTTPRPTTPGICVDDCDLAGTIKLVGGAKWVPELLDPNTKEYQLLANSVQSELENIYNSSPMLKKWYRKIRIDSFSEGSVLVDFLVEFNEIGQKVDTQQIKRLFHESLTETPQEPSNREGKALNESKAERLSLGKFEVDPKYTDFVVIPKNAYPTVGYADEVLLPQWAIAVIVIGLASLLFVIIFGATVLFNRHKNSKKSPAPLTEDMLNELNKNHMGGIETYETEDFYNMEDVWSDKHYEQKPHKKRTANSSLYDNSTANLYDSWRSQWNGQWNAYNTYYGNQHGSQHSLRRPDHDTNF